MVNRTMTMYNLGMIFSFGYRVNFKRGATHGFSCLLVHNNVHFLHVNGVKKPVPFYTLDVIISVGYRVKSQRGTKFRQWANKVIKDYLLHGNVFGGGNRGLVSGSTTVNIQE